MALELRQQLKLSQQLVMTPQLQQAIKLLQLSRFELVDMVQQELLENPLLEEAVPEQAQEKAEAEENARAVEAAQTAEVMDEGVRENDAVQGADWENYLGEFSSTSRNSAAREAEIPEEGMSFEARLSSKPSLEGHLEWQLRLSDMTPRQMDIGEVIIGNIGSQGYLQATAEEIAADAGCTSEEVEVVLRRIQNFDPVGVAARDPRECLLVQIESYGYEDPILIELVSEHLEDLETKRYKPLARKFRISMEELREYLDLIQSLDPMPGAAYGSSEPQYVSPDVYVYKYEDDFIIVLNEDGLPRLTLNDFYLDSLKSGRGAPEKDYVHERLRSAQWLMKSLYQRQRTLYKVMESIVRFQRGFFENGVTSLRPLILKDVADDIEMHESTISRITTSKYVATPHGLFELKFFFNSALGLDDGSQVGSESVKAQIKSLIGEEDPHHPLSDERIAEILKERLQVNIARRTVAKYRGALGILSSSKRKEIF
ncbi:RNA polymerase sigma-54 factor [Desulfobaculum xiamenense]|uniref:RNA polymerase sigma-54 factor n=1 Tax=Desulfobaculum xiamenense TaxID=995050 RepID=A0A846QKK2_9BACT|nr:RNA polymerase factor sigma-54 [Desulfobaculum xiamenense]NJB66713.1 RNA polymerase sigma-54 factor [Desulfobaculum xiamenense]